MSHERGGVFFTSLNGLSMTPESWAKLDSEMVPVLTKDREEVMQKIKQYEGEGPISWKDKGVEMFGSNVFVSMAGLIGVGKTYMAERLGKMLGFSVHRESAPDEEILAKFYEDQEKYAFELEIQLLLSRYNQHPKGPNNFGKGIIQDRSIYEDLIFAKMLHDDGKISKTQYRTYTGMFEVVKQSLRDNTFVVYLKAKPEICLERIKKRGRECEKGITLEYLTNLSKNYDEFMEKLKEKVNVFELEWDEFQEPHVVAAKLCRWWVDKIYKSQASRESFYRMMKQFSICE